jgi:hypothetical protein
VARYEKTYSLLVKGRGHLEDSEKRKLENSTHGLLGALSGTQDGRIPSPGTFFSDYLTYSIDYHPLAL